MSDTMKRFWQVFHHIVAHPLIGLTNGRLWAWRLHDWTLPRAWPGKESADHPRRWAGLE